MRPARGHIRLVPLADPAGLATADDATLVRAVVARDRRAPAELWTRFSPLVRRILKRSLGPGHDLEDLAQEVFLCVFTKAPTLREPQALRAFVISVTALTARHELRRRWVRRWVRLADDATIDGAADLAAVVPDADAREALVRFYAILDRVGPTDRTAFILRFMEGFELTEVAAALGLSLATVKRRLARVWGKVASRVERDPLLRDYLNEHTPRPGTAIKGPS